MIKFRCKHCNCKLSIPERHAGKKTKCPACRNPITIPTPNHNNEHQTQKATKSGQTDFNSNLLDFPPIETPPPEQPTSTNELQAVEQQMQRFQTQPPPERSLPCFIDIFLYPLNKPAISIIAIIIGIPLLIDLFALLLGQFAFFITIPNFFLKIAMLLYAFWYFCECIRDSAEGNIRAPDVLVNSPGLEEIFLQTFRTLGTIAVALAPAIIYFIKTQKTDTTLFILLIFAEFYVPMALLALLMLDSFYALNPILVIPSILSTFLPYLGLLILFAAIGLLSLFAALGLLPTIIFSIPLLVYLTRLFEAALIYLMLIGAHLLGRFYWNYQEKLNWDV